MLKRSLVLVMSLAFVSSAFAGATVDFVITDFGNTPCNSVDGCTFNPLAGPFAPGQELLVHLMVTPSQDLAIRGVQVDWRASSPELGLGSDIDTVNPPGAGFDGIANFWFDYSNIVTIIPGFGTFPRGTYPATGEFGDPPNTSSTTGGYTDFSNLLQGAGLIPFPAATTWATPGPGGDQMRLTAGVPYRLGGMPVTMPQELGAYTLDLLNLNADSANDGMVIDFGFGTGPGDEVTKWASVSQPRGGNPDLLISYANGPLTLSVIPEPATLVLLGLGGIAVLRRRRS